MGYFSETAQIDRSSPSKYQHFLFLWIILDATKQRLGFTKGLIAMRSLTVTVFAFQDTLKIFFQAFPRNWALFGKNRYFSANFPSYFVKKNWNTFHSFLFIFFRQLIFGSGWSRMEEKRDQPTNHRLENSRRKKGERNEGYLNLFKKKCWKIRKKCKA